MTSDNPRRDRVDDQAVHAEAVADLHALLDALERIIAVATASGQAGRRQAGMATAARVRELRHHLLPLLPLLPAEHPAPAALTSALTSAWYNRLALVIGDPANLSQAALEARLDELEQSITTTLAKRRRPWWRIR